MLLPATLASAAPRSSAPELERLARIDAQRVKLDQQVAVLSEHLRKVQTVLDQTEQHLALTVRHHEEATARRIQTEAALAATRGQFVARIRHRYKRGDPALDFLAVLESDELSDVARTAKYVRSVVVYDRRRIDAYTQLAGQFAAIEVELTDLERRLVSQRDMLTRAKVQLAGLVAERRRLLARVEAESRQHALLLHQLERDPAAARQLTVVLDEESRRIAGQLTGGRAGNIAREDPAATGAAVQGDRPQERPQDGAEQITARVRGRRFLWPASGPVTSEFGFRMHPISGERRFHGGIDIGALPGARVRAVRSGVVVGAGPSGGYGTIVVLDHGKGLATLYAHQSRIVVSHGQRVARGATIGYVGSTGYVTGPHLHFEVRVDGVPQDPRGYL